MADGTANCINIIIAIILPPLGVFLKFGCGGFKSKKMNLHNLIDTRKSPNGMQDLSLMASLPAVEDKVIAEKLEGRSGKMLSEWIWIWNWNWSSIPSRLCPPLTRAKLTDAELTYLRKLARPLPTHFILGRNRNLQGLAATILKLWEKCHIAKIALKGGIQNTDKE